MSDSGPIDLTVNIRGRSFSADPADTVALQLLREVEKVLALRRAPVELGSAIHNALQRIQMHVAAPFVCRREIAIVFDGVIHPKFPMWPDPHSIPNPPIKGAFMWLTEMIEHFTIHVVSHRAKTPEGLRRMQTWFLDWGLDPVVLGALMFPSQRPEVHITVDDRCQLFVGTYPAADQLDSFKAWYEKDAETQAP